MHPKHCSTKEEGRRRIQRLRICRPNGVRCYQIGCGRCVYRGCADRLPPIRPDRMDTDAIGALLTIWEPSEVVELIPELVG